MPLGTEIGLGPGHIVLDWDPAPPKGAQHLTNFRPTSVMAKELPISATAELLCKMIIQMVFFDHATYRSHKKWGKTLRHLGQDSLALRSELSLGHFGTSADLSRQFGPTRLVPKYPGSEVSWVRSVCNSGSKSRRKRSNTPFEESGDR